MPYQKGSHWGPVIIRKIPSQKTHLFLSNGSGKTDIIVSSISYGRWWIEYSGANEDKQRVLGLLSWVTVWAPFTQRGRLKREDKGKIPDTSSPLKSASVPGSEGARERVHLAWPSAQGSFSPHHHLNIHKQCNLGHNTGFPGDHPRFPLPGPSSKGGNVLKL